MKSKKILQIIFLILFFANQTFASSFYFKKDISKASVAIFVGDSNFSYSYEQGSLESHEIFEQGLTRIIVDRQKHESTMLVEQRTKHGYLFLNYKSNGKDWKNTQVSFRAYEVFF